MAADPVTFLGKMYVVPSPYPVIGDVQEWEQRWAYIHQVLCSVSPALSPEQFEAFGHREAVSYDREVQRDNDLDELIGVMGHVYRKAHQGEDLTDEERNLSQLSPGRLDAAAIRLEEGCYP